jgi:hypothetical protein
MRGDTLGPPRRLGGSSAERRLTEGSWKAHGRLTEGSWKAHGRLMEGSWKAHERLMEGSWKAHGRLIEGSWKRFVDSAAPRQGKEAAQPSGEGRAARVYRGRHAADAQPLLHPEPVRLPLMGSVELVSMQSELISRFYIQSRCASIISRPSVAETHV